MHSRILYNNSSSGHGIHEHLSFRTDSNQKSVPYMNDLNVYIQTEVLLIFTLKFSSQINPLVVNQSLPRQISGAGFAQTIQTGNNTGSRPTTVQRGGRSCASKATSARILHKPTPVRCFHRRTSPHVHISPPHPHPINALSTFAPDAIEYTWDPREPILDKAVIKPLRETRCTRRTT